MIRQSSKDTLIIKLLIAQDRSYRCFKIKFGATCTYNLAIRSQSCMYIFKYYTYI